LLVLFALTSCEDASQSEADFEPERPSGVPETAMWIGGVDGGAYVLIEQDDDPGDGIYQASVYGDQAGELWYDGHLKLEPDVEPLPDVSEPSTFSFWDGDILALTDGRRLRSIDEFDPFKQ